MSVLILLMLSKEKNSVSFDISLIRYFAIWTALFTSPQLSLSVVE